MQEQPTTRSGASQSPRGTDIKTELVQFGSGVVLRVQREDSPAVDLDLRGLAAAVRL
jgi:hypothetical protein